MLYPSWLQLNYFAHTEQREIMGKKVYPGALLYTLPRKCPCLGQQASIKLQLGDSCIVSKVILR